MLDSLFQSKSIKPIQLQHPSQISSTSLRKKQLSSRIITLKNKHQNNQNGQQIKVKSIRSIKQVENLHFQCRICLQNNIQSPGNFINPCDCTGTMMYVHQKCFTEWVTRSLRIKRNEQLQKILKQGMDCQICKMKFPIRWETQRTLTNWQQFKQKVQSRPIQFFGMIGFFVLAMILFCVVLSLLPRFRQEPPKSKTNNNQNQSMNFQKIIVLVSVGALAVMLVANIFLIITEFMFTYKIQYSYKCKQLKTIKGIIFEQNDQIEI